MEKAGDILSKALMKAFQTIGAKYLPLFQGFASLVGEKLAKNVFIRDIKNDCLYVDVLHPGWAQALLLKRELLLKRINTTYQGLNIKNLKVRLLKQSVLATNKDKTKLETKSPPQGFNLEELLNQMPDNELKMTLKRLYQVKSKTDPELF